MLFCTQNHFLVALFSCSVTHLKRTFCQASDTFFKEIQFSTVRDSSVNFRLCSCSPPSTPYWDKNVIKSSKKKKKRRIEQCESNAILYSRHFFYSSVLSPLLHLTPFFFHSRPVPYYYSFDFEGLSTVQRVVFIN